MTKINDWIVELQKFSNIWVWQVTEDIHAEDVASVLPPEKPKEELREKQTEQPPERYPKKQESTTQLTPQQRVWSLSLRVWWYILTIIVLFFVFFVWRGF